MAESGEVGGDGDVIGACMEAERAEGAETASICCCLQRAWLSCVRTAAPSLACLLGGSIRPTRTHALPHAANPGPLSTYVRMHVRSRARSRKVSQGRLWKSNRI